MNNLIINPNDNSPTSESDWDINGIQQVNDNELI